MTRTRRSGPGRACVACTSRSNQQKTDPRTDIDQRDQRGPVALAFFGERRGLHAQDTTAGSALAAAGSSVGAGPRRLRGATGPLDEACLSKTGLRCARIAAAIRGRASRLRSKVARCARSLRSRLRASTRGRTVAPEPRPFASRGSPQSLGTRRARIATADREPLWPPSRRSACRWGAKCRNRAERRQAL